MKNSRVEKCGCFFYAYSFYSEIIISNFIPFCACSAAKACVLEKLKTGCGEN
jgi:hypothetical protein